MGSIEQIFNDTLGCLYLVGFFSVIFYGCTCGQVMYYIRNYYVMGDHKHITILVALLWILDTVKTAVDLVAEYHPLCHVVLSTSFSGHYGNWGFCQTAENIFVTLPSSHISGSIRPACAAAFDIYITVWLCYHLQDSKTGLDRSQTDYMVTKLINYSITRGIVTSVVQIIGLVLFVIDYQNDTLWFMLFYIPASTIYVNSLLAMWNARSHLKMAGDPPSSSSVLSAWKINTQPELPPEPC
ncbi:hypothetical protein C8Q72DRAFT_797158 [Fomitopsis betulina]|nr:hypothetical protein C8Q72DRAFT_797158 [Fomitopsis betulina]